jgi:hypothetical protein
MFCAINRTDLDEMTTFWHNAGNLIRAAMTTEGLAAYLASRAKLDALRAAIDEGDASGIAQDSSMASVLAAARERLGLPQP